MDRRRTRNDAPTQGVGADRQLAHGVLWLSIAMRPAVSILRVLHRPMRGVSRTLRTVAGKVVTGVARTAEYLAYRRWELALVGLLAGSLVVGLAVDTWRRRAPTVLARLEVEPGRLATLREAGPSARRVPRVPPRGRAESPPGPGQPAPAAQQPAPSPEHPLDLNRATPTDLTQLPGIGPRLAARIVAYRQARGGRFTSPDELAAVAGVGARRAAALRPLVTATGNDDGTLGLSEPDPATALDPARDPDQVSEPDDCPADDPPVDDPPPGRLPDDRGLDDPEPDDPEPDDRGPGDRGPDTRKPDDRGPGHREPDDREVNELLDAVIDGVAEAGFDHTTSGPADDAIRAERSPAPRPGGNPEPADGERGPPP